MPEPEQLLGHAVDFWVAIFTITITLALATFALAWYTRALARDNGDQLAELRRQADQARAGNELAERGLQVESRRQAAIQIAQWLQSAEAGILAAFDPENWRVPDGVEYGPETGIKPGDTVAPSQARFGRRVEQAIEEFESIRGLARLSFGPEHDVTHLVNECIAAIRRIADRGVIYADEDGPRPQAYVDEVFRPLASDLFEALAESCELRSPGERAARSAVSAGDTPSGGGTP